MSDPQPQWLSLKQAAPLYGFRSPRSLRLWLIRHKVSYRPSGNLCWVKAADLESAIEALPASKAKASSTPQGPEETAGKKAAARLLMGGV